jgi:ABC-type Zn uptake system ZnuABC Zn-binding protein ZnuA
MRVLYCGVIAVCVALASASLAQERLRVVTTTTDLRSLVDAVGGERVDVTSIVPANVDAEEYQPKPSDALRLKDTRVVVRVGLDYDLWFDRLLAQATLSQSNVHGIWRGGPGYVDASANLAILDIRGASVGPSDGHAHGSGNPHHWLDPKNADIITGNILEVLARVDPQNSPYYEANRIAFLQRLEAKIGEWTAKLAPLQSRPIIAYHNDWAYFARRFRLNFAGFIEQRPGVPPSPSHLAELIRVMREQNVRIVVRQPYEPEKDTRFLADKAGAKIVLLAGSVGGLPGARDYISLFDANVAALLAAQESQ